MSPAVPRPPEAQYANDTSGNGNTGNLGVGSSSPTWAIGKHGQALEFDGSNDYVSYGDITIESTDLTITAWIYPNTLSADEGTILSKWIVGSAMLFRTGTDGSLKFRTKTNPTMGEKQTAAGLISTGAWQHVAVVYDDSANDATMYINGGPVANSQLDEVLPNIQNVSDAMTSGLRPSDPTEDEFDGKIDDIRLYDYARTPAQIAWEYNRGGPVGWWQFDECQGSTAYDASGNENNGTITPGTGTPPENTAVGICSSDNNYEMWNDGTTGKRNASLGFDGNDDYVDMGTSSELNLSDTYSLAAWIKTSDTGSYRAIVGRWDRPSFRQYSLNINASDEAEFVTTSTLSLPSTSTVTDGNWHHLVATYSKGDFAKIYVDGKLENTDNSPPNTPSYPALSTQIGISTDEFYVSGQIDDVRIYNYALTQQQIKNVMNEGAIRFGPETGSPE